jgi:cysteine desulfurase
MEAEGDRLRALRNRLLDRIVSQIDDVTLNGDLDRRLPGNLNLSFAYVEGESLLVSLNGIAVSSGSACTSASLEPSHVLKAIGLSEELAHASIRFSLGRFNTDNDVDVVAERVVSVVRQLRALSPLYEMLMEGRTHAAPEN